ncbi:hypothetical protein F511_09092 [Dorcoceras hygrometricum]|nr:hypothetical protein F511_09092 [Dorcoceras hygrometricum]
MKICWFWCELKLLLADIARSVRLSEEVTRVSQHFGMLTIEFSRWLVELVARAVDRYDDIYVSTYIGCLASHLSGTCAWLQPVFQEPGASRLIAVDSSIRSTTRLEAPSSDCTRSPDEINTIGFSTSNWPEQISGDDRRRRRRRKGGGGGVSGEDGRAAMLRVLV